MRIGRLLRHGQSGVQALFVFCCSWFGPEANGQTFGNYPAAYPDRIQKGDFNRDGILDLVTASWDDPRVSILLGNADGSFRPARYVPVGKSNSDVAVGDVNGDGKLDLVLATASPNGAIAVLLGQGDGTFQTPTYLPVPSSQHVALADLNGDRVLDLLTGAGKAVAIYLGTGTGQFTPRLTIPIADYAFSQLVVADFNRDGKLDVAVNTDSGVLSLLLGVGDATFRPAMNLAVGRSGPNAEIAVGDFNGDGNLDVGVAENNYPSFNGTIRIFLGAGNGTFQQGADASLASLNALAPEAFSIEVADMDGDGRLDLVVGVGYSNISPDVAILFGNGDGTFQPILKFGLVNHLDGFPEHIVIGDFNRDGKPDFAVAVTTGLQPQIPNYIQPGDVAVYLNTTNFTIISSVLNATWRGTAVWDIVKERIPSRPVSPGEIVTISGTRIGPPRRTEFQLTDDGLVSPILEQTRVLFDGIPSPLLYVQSDELSAVVPYAVWMQDRTSVQVEYKRQKSNTLTLQVVAAAPLLYSTEPNQALIFNEDGGVNSPTNAAAKGSVVTFFATGEGQTSPLGVDGKLGADPLPQPILPVSVVIFGTPAEIVYAGGTPGVVAGLMQLNIRIPSDAISGRLPIILKLGDFSSQIGLTIAIQ